MYYYAYYAIIICNRNIIIMHKKDIEGTVMYFGMSTKHFT